MLSLNELIPLALIIITCIISIIGFNNHALIQRTIFSVGAIRLKKQYHRYITSAFVHIDFMHLLFNMITLYFFSRVIVQVYGVWLFLLLYFGAVLAGSLFSYWTHRNQIHYTALGASAGVSGVLFATVALAPLQTIYLFFIPVTAWIFATLYFAYSVAMLLSPRPWSHSDHAAHLGGAVCGMLFMATFTPSMYWHYVEENALYIGIMCLPLLYLAYEILMNQKGMRK